jgi:hypothetical protein
MRKYILALMMLLGAYAFSGQIGLPQERMAIPDLQQGNYLVCIWDEAANDWYSSFTSYDHAGSINVQLPELGNWYWVGLWSEQSETYVCGKWIGHFVTH